MCGVRKLPCIGNIHGRSWIRKGDSKDGEPLLLWAWPGGKGEKKSWCGELRVVCFYFLFYFICLLQGAKDEKMVQGMVRVIIASA